MTIRRGFAVFLVACVAFIGVRVVQGLAAHPELFTPTKGGRP